MIKARSLVSYAADLLKRNSYKSVCEYLRVLCYSIVSVLISGDKGVVGVMNFNIVFTDSVHVFFTDPVCEEEPGIG